jgi:hypothetical protein
MGDTLSSGLILSPMQDCAELSKIWSLSSRGVPREEVFWSLAFYCHSPHEAPPYEGLPCWASIFLALLGQSWAVEVAQEQVDWDTPVSSTPIEAKSPGTLIGTIWDLLKLICKPVEIVNLLSTPFKASN